MLIRGLFKKVAKKSLALLSFGEFKPAWELAQFSRDGFGRTDWVSEPLELVLDFA